MADVVYSHLSGLPPQEGHRNVAMADGTFAEVAMGVAGLTPVQSLSAVSATGPGAALDNVGVRNNHSLMLVTAGTVSGGTVQLEASQDGVNYISLLGTALAPLSATSTVWLGVATLTPFRFLRANIKTAITGGGSITGYVASAG